MKVAIIARDKPGALNVRLATRDAHLAYLNASSVIDFAGPLLNEDGDLCGSLLVLEVETLSEAQDWAAGDPYAQAGLFEDVRIQEWKKVIG